jgi:hypothetical protein
VIATPSANTCWSNLFYYTMLWAFTVLLHITFQTTRINNKCKFALFRILEWSGHLNKLMVLIYTNTNYIYILCIYFVCLCSIDQF